MADYTELVKELRYCVDGDKECAGCKRYGQMCCEVYLMEEAADAIEELAAFRNALEDGRLYIMRDGVLYVSSNYKMPDGAKTARLPAIVDFHKAPPKEETE